MFSKQMIRILALSSGIIVQMILNHYNYSKIQEQHIRLLRLVESSAKNSRYGLRELP